MTYSLSAITVFILVEANKISNHLFTRLWLGQPGNSFHSRHRQIFFSPSQRVGPLWGPPTDLSFGYPGLLCVQRPGTWRWSLPDRLSSAEVTMIHGNNLHSPTHFQAVVLKGAVKVASYLFMERQKKKVFYAIASRSTVHVIKAPTDYSDLLDKGVRGVLSGLSHGCFSSSDCSISQCPITVVFRCKSSEEWSWRADDLHFTVFRNAMKGLDCGNRS